MMTHDEWAEQLEALLADGLNEPLASHLPPMPDAFAAAAWAGTAFGPLKSGSVGDALELVRALDERLEARRRVAVDAARSAIHGVFDRVEALAMAGRLPNVIRWDSVPPACQKTFRMGVPGSPGSLIYAAAENRDWAPPPEAAVDIRGVPTLVVGPRIYPWFSFEWCRERGQELVRALAAAEEQTRLQVEYDDRLWRERNAPPPPSDRQKIAKLEREVAEMKKAFAAK